jgi:hypothetical protein
VLAFLVSFNAAPGRLRRPAVALVLLCSSPFLRSSV